MHRILAKTQRRQANLDNLSYATRGRTDIGSADRAWHAPGTGLRTGFEGLVCGRTPFDDASVNA
jgi:hypothetical protein